MAKDQEEKESSEERLEEFRSIIKGLKKIKQEEKLGKLGDDILFDAAVRIYNSISINRPRGVIKKKSDGNAPLTEKQKNLLQDLGYTGDMSMSKAEATRKIQDYINQRKNQNF